MSKIARRLQKILLSYFQHFVLQKFTFPPSICTIVVFEFLDKNECLLCTFFLSFPSKSFLLFISCSSSSCKMALKFSYSGLLSSSLNRPSSVTDANGCPILQLSSNCFSSSLRDGKCRTLFFLESKCSTDRLLCVDCDRWTIFRRVEEFDEDVVDRHDEEAVLNKEEGETSRFKPEMVYKIV